MCPNLIYFTDRRAICIQMIVNAVFTNDTQFSTDDATWEFILNWFETNKSITVWPRNRKCMLKFQSDVFLATFYERCFDKTHCAKPCKLCMTNILVSVLRIGKLNIH